MTAPVRRHREVRENIMLEDNVHVVVRDADTGAVLQDGWTHNIPCVGWGRWGAEQFRADSTEDEIDQFQLGTGTDTPAWGNEQVSGPAGTTDVATTEPAGEAQMLAAGFLDADEFNGMTLTRVGAITSSGHLVNHAEISPIDKTEAKVVNISIYLNYPDPTTL